jgi:hypothetical protein
MPLAEVVMEIVEEMEDHARRCDSEYVALWAKQLRRAVKAAEGSSVIASVAEPLRVPNEIILGGTTISDPNGCLSQQNQPSPRHLVMQAGRDPWEAALKQGATERLQKESAHLQELAKDFQVSTNRQESAGQMTMLIGGHSDGEFIQTDGKMPVGAHTMISGEVYTLQQDRKLHFDQEETSKLIERLNKPNS